MYVGRNVYMYAGTNILTFHIFIHICLGNLV